VRKATRKKCGFRIEQQPRGFASAGSHDDGSGVNAFLRARGFVNVRDAGGFAFFVYKNFASHRSGDKRELPRFHRWRNEDLAGAEIRGGDAAAPTLAAVVTRETAVNGFGKDCEARWDASDTQLVASLLDHQFRAAWFGWREKNSV